MSKVIQDLGLREGRCPDLWNVLQGVHPGDPLVWIRDLGNYPQDWTDHWGIPPQGGPPFSRDEAAARYNGVVGVPAFGGGNKYHCPVHCNSSDTVAVSGGGAASESAGGTEVVGSREYRLGGREGGGK